MAIDRGSRWMAAAAVAISSAHLAGFALPAQAADEPAATFDVFELRVIGNSKLSELDIDRLLYVYLGPKRTLKDVEAARLALETMYHERGFGTVFVDIPEQSVEEGLVRLRVSESALGRV